MASSWQAINSKVHLLSDRRKGFIKKTKSGGEHRISLSELLHDANRRKQALIVTAIDFTNAFGSVLHEFTMSAMRQRGFPMWTQAIVDDMYDGASLVIEVRGSRTGKMAWNRGVKQGCPLGPPLLNLYVEPLLQTSGKNLKELGAFVGPEEVEDRVGLTVEASADDLIFISRTTQGMKLMPSKLE
jgi:hypothetical protein